MAVSFLQYSSLARNSFKIKPSQRGAVVTTFSWPLLCLFQNNSHLPFMINS